MVCRLSSFTAAAGRKGGFSVREEPDANGKGL